MENILPKFTSFSIDNYPSLQLYKPVNLSQKPSQRTQRILLSSSSPSSLSLDLIDGSQDEEEKKTVLLKKIPRKNVIIQASSSHSKDTVPVPSFTPSPLSIEERYTVRLHLLS